MGSGDFVSFTLDIGSDFRIILERDYYMTGMPPLAVSYDVPIEKTFCQNI